MSLKNSWGKIKNIFTFLSGTNNPKVIQYVKEKPNEIIENFYILSQEIDQVSDINAKIAACEKSYLLLPQFVRLCLEDPYDGKLPPIVNCRDIGPELYMRLGKWMEAKSAIDKCIAANAYYPDSGKKQLEDLENYKSVAEKIILFLKENPGFQQKDLYKALNFSEDEKEDARHFCRCSLQIRKEPFNKTNRLYVLNNE